MSLAIGKEGLIREAEAQGEAADKMLEGSANFELERRASFALVSIAHSLRELNMLVRVAIRAFEERAK